jgi:DNA-binding PadR family transcriptional regulator
MIELMILGFLAEEPLHGYEIKRRIEQLHGYASTVSDGTLYPAITRLLREGLVIQLTTAPGSRRKTLGITQSGKIRLERMLSEAHGHDITDMNRFFVILAFLSALPNENDRKRVLRRRLDYLEGAQSFFYKEGEPLHICDIDDPYRQVILRSAKAVRDVQVAWLRKMLA